VAKKNQRRTEQFWMQPKIAEESFARNGEIGEGWEKWVVGKPIRAT